MRPAVVIVGDVLRHDMIEVLLANDDEMVQRLVLDTLNPTLDEGVQVRRARADRFDLNAALLEDLIERPRELAVQVPDENLARAAVIFNMLQECLGLSLHPVRIRPGRAFRDKHPPRGDVQKRHRENLSWPLQGPDPLAEEVALPKRFGVGGEKLFPASLPAPGTRVESVFDQDVLDRLPRDPTDTKLTKLTQNAAVAR